jgi:AraC-like DNA-binding protein
LFSQPLLRPQAGPALRPALLWHALPILGAAGLPAERALPLAFVLGAAYLLWLARSLYELRRERARFRLEMILLGAVFVIAVGVAGLGLVQAQLPDKLFFTLYAISIGLAFVLVQTTLGLRPQLSTEVCETAQAAYVSSTLGNVDCAAALVRLQELMRNDRVYVDAALSLPGLAERLGLSAHQLSELINARLGKGFSRYLREQRIAAAKAMLCAEPSASVLAVGLSVGFSAQSNFYEAFREIEGMTPGQYRKLKLKAGSPE